MEWLALYSPAILFFVFAVYQVLSQEFAGAVLAGFGFAACLAWARHSERL